MATSRRSAFAVYAGPQKKPVIDRSLLCELSDVSVLENQASARKVTVAAAIWDSCIHQNVQVGDHIMDAGNYAASEIAKILGCSKTVADTFAEVGMDLRLRLPAVRAAFDAGELDLARVRAICRTTGSYSLGAAERVESEVLEAARRLSPGPLATEIAGILQREAPDESAEIRKDLESLTRVRYRDKDMIATIEADLEAGDAAACWQLINEMAATLCSRDPRTRGQRLAAAYTAIMHRESYVRCTCEVDDDHPCTANRELPDRRAPLTNVTIDLASLAGLADLPAFLAGHGLIDADYARELVANGDWQLVLTEAVNLAEKLGVVGGEENAESAGSGTDSPDNTATSAAAAAAPGSRNGGHLTFNPLGRGRRRRGSTLPTPPVAKLAVRPGGRPTSEYHGSYTLIAALEAAITANPALAAALYADGHGGFVEPPDGALGYRPSAKLADCVRLRDRTCRHPGCDVPAANCELDHVVPYLHNDPMRGGWTISSNLHCLCRYHHMLKTMGVWIPTMLAGAVDYWVSSSGTTAITLPGSTVGTTDFSGDGLLPHIPRRRRATCADEPGGQGEPTKRADAVTADLSACVAPTDVAPTDVAAQVAPSSAKTVADSSGPEKPLSEASSEGAPF
ncbi:DUF222 domain-containing protein [Rhodococcus sp. G-MC3]|uniref:HNH endonuclease signature motif containing protein n=1 Tax=Rhodococcus sp. G-MC3 TaxID=3046209 RepID=UPI0024BB9CB5|nr:HNH endonuclease signature motif containing protein [Rhodococcus sp. G-MC3]MDJ0395351.1 DUF222 domain-containing protein [Rhodococcus sp. G-MC3]